MNYKTRQQNSHTAERLRNLAFSFGFAQFATKGQKYKKKNLKLELQGI